MATSPAKTGKLPGRALLLCGAHDLLRRFAARHGLISEKESKLTEKELDRIFRLLTELK